METKDGSQLTLFVGACGVWCVCDEWGVCAVSVYGVCGGLCVCGGIFGYKEQKGEQYLSPAGAHTLDQTTFPPGTGTVSFLSHFPLLVQ